MRNRTMIHATETTQTKTAISIACPSVEERLSQTSLAVVLSSASLVSLWSFAGLAGAVLNNGSAAMARGLLTAITGV